MINVIFSFIPTLPLTSEQLSGFKQAGAEWSQVPECKPGTSQADVPDIEKYELIKSALGQLGTVAAIGLWDCEQVITDVNGNQYMLQYGFEKQVDDQNIETIIQIQNPLLYPFDKAAYLDALNDIVITDENGIEISRSRPTGLTPVNKFSGMADRDLT